MRLFFASVMLLSSMTIAFAQQQLKVGRIDVQQVYDAMPEKQQVLKEIEQIEAKYEVEASKLEEEYNNKIAQFFKEKDNLLENIQDARAQEIEQLAQRLQKFREIAAEDLKHQQETKLAPIIERINKAINTVGEREGFYFVFDSSQGNMLYFNQDLCIDIYPMVIKELNIR